MTSIPFTDPLVAPFAEQLQALRPLPHPTGRDPQTLKIAQFTGLGQHMRLWVGPDDVTVERMIDKEQWIPGGASMLAELLLCALEEEVLSPPANVPAGMMPTWQLKAHVCRQRHSVIQGMKALRRMLNDLIAGAEDGKDVVAGEVGVVAHHAARLAREAETREALQRIVSGEP